VLAEVNRTAAARHWAQSVEAIRVIPLEYLQGGPEFPIDHCYGVFGLPKVQFSIIRTPEIARSGFDVQTLMDAQYP